MIQFNNQNNFSEIHYNGHDIQKVYDSDAHLVWDKQTPPTPTPFDGKFKFTLNDSSVVSAECDSSSVIKLTDVINYQTNLISCEIGDCITSIDSYAFNSCSGLTSIAIPNSLTSIGTYAFYSCSGLTSIVIPSGVTNISENVFNFCTSLTSCTINGDITNIDNNAFRGCTSLTSITIPNSVTSIGRYAFYGCDSLTNITIEATTPPTLGSNPFYDTNDCPIFVPSESVNTYKAASGWSTYASRIQTIQ